MTNINRINKAVSLFFEVNPTIAICKCKDLMPICIKMGMFNKDHREGLPLRNLLRKLDDSGNSHLITSLKIERKVKNRYWYFIRE